MTQIIDLHNLKHVYDALSCTLSGSGKMGISKPKKGHKKKGHSAANRSYKQNFMNLRRRTRDIDQIQEDIQIVLSGKDLPGIVDEDKPGGGLHYCVPCAQHFINASTLLLHMRSKTHKKRVKLVREPPYTHKDADAAAGCSGSDTAR